MNISLVNVGHVLVMFTGLVLGSATASAQCLREDNQKLEFTNENAWDEFGKSVDLDGDVAVMGAPRDHTAGVEDAGTATVFRLELGQWTQERVLRASDLEQGDHLGTSVGVAGNWVIAGAPAHAGTTQYEGAVYAFEWNGLNWVERQKLTASSPAEYGHFGTSCAIEGDLAAVGYPGYSYSGFGRAGSVELFRYDGTTWNPEQVLLAGDPGYFAEFGSSVAISPARDVVVVGADGDDTQGFLTGAAYVFRHDGIQWVKEQKLLASDAATQDYFGWAVAVDGNVIAVGAPFDDGFGDFSGSAYAFRHDGLQWVEEQKLSTGDSETREWFGFGLAVEGNTLAVSAPEDEVGAIGAAGATYVYTHDGASWVLDQTLVSRDPRLLARQGHSTAMDARRILVGAPYDDVDPTADCGAAYIYNLSERDMTLDASPNIVQVGDTITFSTWCGPQGRPVWLFTGEINGVPSIFKVTKGLFDGASKWSLSATVPPGVVGLLISFQSIAFDSNGRPKFSNLEEATFL